jgi:hypothetical protein
VTNLDFLAGLPAVLGIGGYVAYHLSRSREQASPILKTIVAIIGQKGEALPELDGRLAAKHVFSLLARSPELRRRLEPKDYALLESVMKRDERSHVFAMIGLVVALLMSLGAYAYLQTHKPRIVSASVAAGARSGSPTSVANTIDDLVVSWNHSGENQPFTLSVLSANAPEAKVVKHVMAADHTARLSAAELRALWPHPALGNKTALRVEFSDDNGFKSFGPFDVVMALELMYVVDGRHLTVASMNGQGMLVPHSFESKCVAWPKTAKNGKAQPRSLSLSSSNGKATGDFASDFDPDPKSLKCVYFGSYPIELVRYSNLWEK